MCLTRPAYRANTEIPLVEAQRFDNRYNSVLPTERALLPAEIMADPTMLFDSGQSMQKVPYESMMAKEIGDIMQQQMMINPSIGYTEQEMMNPPRQITDRFYNQDVRKREMIRNDARQQMQNRQYTTPELYRDAGLDKMDPRAVDLFYKQ